MSTSFTSFVEKRLGKFAHFVIYALLEWVLIFLLFLHGFIAFIVNEYAWFFELKTPCWLCTRFDHILVHKNPDFYYGDCVCESHKKQISSLAFCHNHKKLSDIRKMCEGCLLSFAIEKESDIDTYKSLVGILHKDLECFVEDGLPIQLSLKDDHGFMSFEKSSTQTCSCCGEPLRVKPSNGKVRKHSALSPLAPSPSPQAIRTPGEKSEEPAALELPHVQYTELKFFSDTDSDLQEDDISSITSSQNFQTREDTKDVSVPLLFEAEDLKDESSKLTPTFKRENKFFGISLTDYANDRPKWSNRTKTSQNTEVATESNDHSDFNDTILNHFKRQVHLDRKSLMALYMELDEERSASAIAANNAMALITRLQDEKAAVQMEAFQYQRMMEEQAKYDEEALQATDEMLLKREEELKALEAELDFYKNKFRSLAEDVLKEPPLTLNDGEDSLAKGLNSNQSVMSQAENGEGRNNEPTKDVNVEKTYLHGGIKKVENRTHFAENGIHSLQSSSDSVNNIDNVTEKGSEAFLPSALSSLTEKVKALEASSGFIEKNGEGTKILTEISQQLEKLNHLVMVSA